MNETPILSADGLVKQVSSPEGTLTILDGVSLTVRRGESLAIAGASGSGKSTLLGLLAGLDLPTRGGATIAGHELNRLDEDGRAAVRAGHVGFVFQNFQLLGSLTALENVMLPLELGGHPDPRGRALEVLDEVGLAQRTGHYPSQLSGGEQQRVAIARAFANRPSLLFADELTGNLDARTGGRIIDLLFRLNESEGTTLVLVTHDTALAARCNRVLEIDAGRFVGAAPSNHDVGAAPSNHDVGAAPSNHDVGAAPSRRDVGAAPSNHDVGAAPSRRDVGAAPSRRDSDDEA